jgi:hypothetical protein
MIRMRLVAFKTTKVHCDGDALPLHKVKVVGQRHRDMQSFMALSQYIMTPHVS